MEAAGYGHVETVQYLISKGADVNARRKGLTPLLVACDHFSVQFGPVGDKNKTVYLLLENGADVNVQDESWLKSGMTPLMFAVVQGDAAMVQAILAKGAKTGNAEQQGRHRPVACKERRAGIHLPAARSACKAPGGSPQQAKASPEALIDAIRQGRLDTVKALVSEGADVNCSDKERQHAADVCRGQEQARHRGIPARQGGRCKRKERHQRHGFDPCLGKGIYSKVANVLLQSKADANIKNISGGDALIYAVLNKRLEMVRLLLDNGAKIDETL